MFKFRDSHQTNEEKIAYLVKIAHRPQDYCYADISIALTYAVELLGVEDEVPSYRP
jgi:hypothetical protein